MVVVRRWMKDDVGGEIAEWGCDREANRRNRLAAPLPKRPDGYDDYA